MFLNKVTLCSEVRSEAVKLFSWPLRNILYIIILAGLCSSFLPFNCNLAWPFLIHWALTSCNPDSQTTVYDQMCVGRLSNSKNLWIYSNWKMNAKPNMQRVSSAFWQRSGTVHCEPRWRLAFGQSCAIFRACALTLASASGSAQSGAALCWTGFAIHTESSALIDLII